MVERVERDIAGRKLVLETGKLAMQAHGAVKVQYGDTVVLVTAVMGDKPRPGVDFLPLTVDYEERMYAAGKIPGSFFRREGRPGTEAILAARLTDRPLRPLFPKGLRNDVQVVATVLSVDKENSPETLSIIGASAALHISQIPWDGPVAGTRIGYSEGELLVNPTFDALEKSNLNLVVAGTHDAVVMVEAGAEEISEDTMVAAVNKAMEVNQQVIEMIEELRRRVGKPKVPFTPDFTRSDELNSRVASLAADRMVEILREQNDKVAREAKLAALQAEVFTSLGTYQEEYSEAEMAGAFEKQLQKIVRTRILDEGIRPDGRRLEDIRPITCEVDVLPRTHGTGLFTRGLTQVLSVVTLGSMSMKQTLDTLSPEETKRFMHHYNFPPFSVGEARRMGSPGRREIGHGALAERALLAAVPSEDEFPYAIRIVSDVLSSNGSTSMASVCGSTLAMMDAGVPIRAPVAGVAMGMVLEGNRHAILTDIEGMEDFLGDMDFKVAGTPNGVTALQLDIKIKGLTPELLSEALQRANKARMYILGLMLQTIQRPRGHLSQYAPKMLRIQIPPEKIGLVIGSGGRTIRGIIEDTGASVDVNDDGVVIVGAQDETAARRAVDRIQNLTRDLTVGDILTGKVTRMQSFGVFVEIMPGKDGLIRSGDLGDLRDVKVGDEVTVQIVEIDNMGRINLSRRALLGDEAGEGAEPAAPRPGGFGERRGPPPGRGGFGDRRGPPPGRGGFGERRGPPPRRDGGFGR